MKEILDTLESGGMKAVEKKFRVTRVQIPQLPKPPKAIGPKKAKAVREKMLASQPVFASLLGVSSQTIKAWEQGTKKPSGIARRLLSEIDRDPDYWRGRLAELAT